MTTGRILLLLTLLLVLLFFPMRVLQFIALLYVAVIALSYLYSRIVYRYLTVRRKDLVLRAHRFEPMTITLSAENRGPLPVAYLNIFDTPNYFFSSEPGNFLLGLKPGERRILSYQIESQSRGEYVIGPAVISGSDPLGLFPFRLRAGESQTLIVYPEVLPLELDTLEGLPAGTIRVENRIYEDMTRYRSLREYLPGDDPRRVSWKASARTGKLFVMDYLPLLYCPVLILLNLRLEDYPMRFRHHWVERAVILAASLVAHFLSLRQEIGLIASGRLGQGGDPAVAEIRGTHEHATALLEMLARIQAAEGLEDFTLLPFQAGIEIPVRTRLEVITPGLSPQQWSRLRQFREKGASVEVFLLGGERPEQADPWSREAKIYTVQDFGSELIYH